MDSTTTRRNPYRAEADRAIAERDKMYHGLIAAGLAPPAIPQYRAVRDRANYWKRRADRFDA